jgi:hypothetical protein
MDEHPRVTTTDGVGGFAAIRSAQTEQTPAVSS